MGGNFPGGRQAFSRCSIASQSYLVLPLSPLPQMVMYESARAMVNLKNVTAKELQPAVSGSQ